MTNNFCIILAGGIGSRLWPLSQDHCPKQFLDPFGSGRTLLQSTFDRMLRLVPLENIYISTTAEYRQLTVEQLPDVPADHILAEPVRRGTFSAVAWAMTIISERNPEADVLVSPADQLILREESFVKDVNESFAFVHDKDCFILMGVRPTRPDTCYGYMQLNDEPVAGSFSRVKSFTEKPDRQFAEMFVKSGEFLWNTGLYVFHAPTFFRLVSIAMPDHVKAVRQAMAEQQGTLSQVVEQHYGYLPNTSLDKAVTEQYGHVGVRVSSFGWADMGNWSSLYADLPADQQGNVRLHTEATFYNGSGNVITLPRGQKAFVAGLNDYIIAQQDGILMICPKGDVAMRRHMMTDASMATLRP